MLRRPPLTAWCRPKAPKGRGRLKLFTNTSAVNCRAHQWLLKMSPHASGSQEVDVLEEFTSFGSLTLQEQNQLSFFRVQNSNQAFDKGRKTWFSILALTLANSVIIFYFLIFHFEIIILAFLSLKLPIGKDHTETFSQGKYLGVESLGHQGRLLFRVAGPLCTPTSRARVLQLHPHHHLYCRVFLVLLCFLHSASVNMIMWFFFLSLLIWSHIGWLSNIKPVLHSRHKLSWSWCI